MLAAALEGISGTVEGRRDISADMEQRVKEARPEGLAKVRRRRHGRNYGAVLVHAAASGDGAGSPKMSGRSSSRLTRPSVARLMATANSALNVRRPLIMSEIVCWAQPAAAANLTWLPMISTARFTASEEFIMYRDLPHSRYSVNRQLHGSCGTDFAVG